MSFQCVIFIWNQITKKGLYQNKGKYSTSGLFATEMPEFRLASSTGKDWILAPIYFKLKIIKDFPPTKNKKPADAFWFAWSHYKLAFPIFPHFKSGKFEYKKGKSWIEFNYIEFLWRKGWKISIGSHFPFIQNSKRTLQFTTISMCEKEIYEILALREPQHFIKNIQISQEFS